MRQAPSTASFASTASTSHSHDPSGGTASAAVFRNLNFRASIPLHIVIKSEELPVGADRTIDNYYIQAPRITYLPLLLQTIKKQFLSLILDERAIEELKDDQFWFEAEGNQGGPLKWHWPLGVLYDYHHALSHPNLTTTDTYSPSSETTVPPSLASVFAPFNPSFSLSSPSSQQPDQLSLPFTPTRGDSQSTLRATTTTTTSRSSSLSVSSSSPPQPPPPSILPWRLILHLSNPPQELLLMKPGIMECKQGYMNRLKESDHIRFGASKRRLNNLRKEEQDSLWDGVITGNFDLFWSVANKLIPSPSPPFTSNQHQENTSTLSLALPPSSTPQLGSSPSNTGGTESLLKNVPIRTVLAGDSGGGGGRTYSIPFNPFSPSGHPTTLHSYLSSLFPLLFPRGEEKKGVYALVQGIQVPLESEVGWLGANMTGGDGWVWVVVGIHEEA